ncbi:hypothetical protein, partial [Luteimonas sp. FCS-9]
MTRSRPVASKRLAKSAAGKRKDRAPKRPIFQSLSHPPKSSDAYLWCDYIEIRCLVHPDRKFSRSNLIECVDELAALDIRPDASLGDDSEALDEEAELDAEEQDDDGDDEVLPDGDRKEAWAAGLFGRLEVRAKVFGDAYPFALAPGAQEIRFKNPGSGAQSLYVQLLLSACLRLIEKSRRHELTEDFERIAESIFKGLMPAGWEVHQFGAKASTRYSGHLFKRLTKLAE